MGIRWSEDFWVTLERVPMAGSCKPEQKPCEEEVTAVCQEALSITDMAKKLQAAKTHLRMLESEGDRMLNIAEMVVDQTEKRSEDELAVMNEEWPCTFLLHCKNWTHYLTPQFYLYITCSSMYRPCTSKRKSVCTVTNLYCRETTQEC